MSNKLSRDREEADDAERCFAQEEKIAKVIESEVTHIANEFCEKTKMNETVHKE